MDIQPRDVEILRFLAEHYTATAEQLRAAVSPESRDTKVIRRRLGLLRAAGFCHATQAEALTAHNAVHARVWYPSHKGMELLALRTGAMRYLLTPTKPPYSYHLAHFLALTDLRVLIKKAVSFQSAVTLADYFNQFDTVNPVAQEPSQRFKLHTVVQAEGEHKVVCVPDAAFALRLGATAKAYYVELERGTTAPRQAAAKKSPGYAGLFARRLHRRHFPDALDEFAVLVLAPHAAWRDELRREFAKRPAAHLYKFAALPEVTPESLLFSPVWHPCAGDPQPLVKLPKGGVPQGVALDVRPGTGGVS
jgi:hypothetical protein